MVESVAAIGSFAGEHAPGSHFTQAGQLHVATNSAQLARLNRWVTDHHRFGMSETDYRGLSIAEIAGKIRVAGVVGGYFTPHCAVVNPRPLIDALAALCESLGVHIFENTRAEEITPGRVRTRQGDVKCTVVVRATEGYTANFRRDHRELMPIFSLMIATEPLAQDVWDEIGWAERFAFSDGRNLIIYAQRTADDRIAFGGRGAPYRFGSNTHDRFADNIGAHMILRKELVRLFPVLADTAITHRWGGILGVSRDWNASVGFDRRSGFAWAGGYVGDGLTATHLAGQTVADLIFRHDTERTTLPWVGHRSRKWEVEPFRTLGVRAISALAASIDEAESRGRHARIRSKVFDLML